MLQDCSEVWAACPVWNKLVCFTLFFNVGIFQKTEITSHSQLQSRLLDCSPEDWPLQTCILTLKYLPQSFQLEGPLTYPSFCWNKKLLSTSVSAAVTDMLILV